MRYHVLLVFLFRGCSWPRRYLHPPCFLNLFFSFFLLACHRGRSLCLFTFFVLTSVLANSKYSVLFPSRWTYGVVQECLLVFVLDDLGLGRPLAVPSDSDGTAVGFHPCRVKLDSLTQMFMTYRLPLRCKGMTSLVSWSPKYPPFLSTRICNSYHRHWLR